MNLHFTLFISLFLSILSIRLCAQEKTDTTHFNEINLNGSLYPTYFDPHLHYNTDIPFLLKKPEERWREYLFNGKGWKKFQLKEGVKNLPDNRLYLIYTSQNNALHYFSAGDPIVFGFDFHLKPIAGWEKLDIYFFGNGMLVYRYPDDKIMPANLASKNFFWETGGGMEYEFRKNCSLFYEYSAIFRNQSLVGTLHKGGVRLRF